MANHRTAADKTPSYNKNMMLDSEAKYAGIVASAMDAIIAVNSRQ